MFWAWAAKYESRGGGDGKTSFQMTRFGWSFSLDCHKITWKQLEAKVTYQEAKLKRYEKNILVLRFTFYTTLSQYEHFRLTPSIRYITIDRSAWSRVIQQHWTFPSFMTRFNAHLQWLLAAPSQPKGPHGKSPGLTKCPEVIYLS